MDPRLFIAAIVIVLPLIGFIAFLFQPSLRIAFWCQRAQNALDRRDYDTAESYYQKVSRIRPKLRDLGQRLAVEFVAEHGLGLCAQQRDDFTTSERHFVRAIELSENGVDCERGVVAHMLAELAIAQRAQGKTAESERTVHRLSDVCEAADESEIHQIAEWVIGAAHGASSRNDNALAFELAQMAQSVLEQLEPWHDGAMAHTQISLASFHLMHCEYGPARELIETAVASAGEELDRSDADTAYFNLGWIYVLSGNLEAAKQAFERSLAFRSEGEGEEHWRTSIVIAALADTHRIAGEYPKAKKYSDAAWRIQSCQLPPGDTIRAGTAANRAMLLIDLGELDDADRLLASAARVAEGRVQRPLLAVARLFQGVAAITRYDHVHAAELLQEAREIAEQTYGEKHRMTCDYRAIQGANLVRMGLYQEAESILAETLKIRESLPDVSVIDLADLWSILAELYLDTDRSSNAESAIGRAQNLIDGRVAETHLLHAELGEMLGRIHHARSEFDAALKHFRRALDIRGKVQRPDHPRLARLFEAYASSLGSVGDVVEADKQRARAEQIRKLYCESNRSQGEPDSLG